jgi:hypothetical protein
MFCNILFCFVLLSRVDFESNTFEWFFLRILTINITLCTKLVLIFYFENIIKPCNKTVPHNSTKGLIVVGNKCSKQSLLGVVNISFHCTRTLTYTTTNKSLLYLSFIFSEMSTLFFSMRWHMSRLPISPSGWHYGILELYYPTSSILWFLQFESFWYSCNIIYKFFL